MSLPKITLIGGPTALIEVGGFRLLTDPTFDPPGEYRLPHVTLKKTSSPALTAQKVGPIDAVLLSHDQHSDTLQVTATPARHGPAGIESLSGDVIGFVITFKDRNARPIYVTGDTVWYDGVAEVARRFHAGVVLLFAGSARTRGPFHLTMDINDAIETAHAFPDATIVPVHYEGWAHFTQGRDDLEKSFNALGFGSQLKVLEPGVATMVGPPG